MRTRLIGGPLDGATAKFGDPTVSSIWPRLFGDEVWYRAYPVAGRPRYVRADESVYVFAGHAEIDRAFDSAVGWDDFKERVT